MEHVSFKDAKLIDVTFSDQCDLSSVIPPNDGRHAIFDRWLQRITLLFDHSRAWENPAREAAEMFYKSCEAHAQDQQWYLIGLDELVKLYGSDVGKRMWDGLLKT